MADPEVLRGDVLRISTLQEGQEVLSSRSFSQAAYADERVDPLLGGTLIAIDGDDHTSRKRMEYELFRPWLLEYYETSILDPALTRRLHAIQDAEQSRVDLIPLVRRILLEVTAAMVGLDLQEDDEVALERLESFAASFGEGVAVRFRPGDPSEIVHDAYRALTSFQQDYVVPSVERRHRSVNRFRNGLLSEDDLPKDLLTLLMLHAPSWSVDDIVREAVLFVTASSDTTLSSVIHTVHETLAWTDQNPMHREDLTDLGFIRACVQEVLRLHPPSPGLLRTAEEDVVLRSGRHIAAGSRVFVDITAANRDKAAAGDDPTNFDPHRALGAGRLHALAFGFGSHVCIGRGMAIGASTGKSLAEPVGTVVRTVARLFEAGVARDPAREPVRRLGSLQERYVEYPVTFQPVNAAS